jgi:ATP-dependent DNA helicase RecG
MKRHQWHQQSTKFRINAPKTKISDFINRLPFTLTKAQVQSATEILTDLGQPKPMNRLLEGDVGSGKTVVAALAMYATHLSGFNSVLMAPTEILAEQHFSTLKSLFAHTKITVGLHTGSTKISKPQDITVGTQALLFKPDLLLEVGLVVIDEQHRFGVGQRAKLQSLPNSPHRLTMSATPIPRTVALTLYGDLDVSLLDEMPKNRLAIKTYLVGPEKRAAAYQWIDKQISTGAQVYVVCPLIDTSSSVLLSEVKAAETEFETLKAIFPNRRLSLLHGKIKPKSKNQLLADYKSGHIDILVTTPVIEVGIDVPNASIMMIESAERFGLAQLHQLRGRVGRGVKQSYCLLFTSSATKTENHRLHALTKHTSGFKLSEIDLKHRGPGEVFGLAQHGFLDLKLASFTDHNLLSITKNASETLIDQDPELKTQPFLKSLITATPETTAN